MTQPGISLSGPAGSRRGSCDCGWTRTGSSDDVVARLRQHLDDHDDPAAEQNRTYPWGRVQRNDDGTLDEIVVDGGIAHLEQTSSGSWCLSITRTDLAVTVWLSTPHGEDGQATAITARWEIGPGANSGPGGDG